MKNVGSIAAIWMGTGLGLLVTACGGGGTTTPPPLTTYVLTVDSTTPSSGVAIVVAPADNSGASNGTTSFTRVYNAGTSVTLTAPTTSGNNTFTSWSGCTTTSTVTCTVTLGANTTVTANYTAPTTYVLTVNSTNPSSGVNIGAAPADNNNTGSGTTSFTLTYNAGTSVTLTAPPTAGSNTFTSWTGCTNTTTVTCNVTLNANTTVTANYAAPTTYVLTVNSTNPASGVTIGAAPADNNSTTSGSTGFTLTYNAGTSVTLTAPATAGSNTFSSWTGCTTASTTTCNVTLNANTTVKANYAAPTTYVLTVNSTNPTSGVTIGAAPADNNSTTSGSTGFTLTYNAGTNVTLTAPATAGSNTFSSWTGCTTTSTVTCNVTLKVNTTVTASYAAPAVAITPNPATAIIGATVQFSAAINGTASSAVTWSAAAPSGSSLSPGTISASGLYTTPYPAPATVTVTATSTQNTNKSATVTVTLTAPAAAAGPALSVDAGNQTHAISPFIYGWNGYTASASAAQAANITVDRFGGDATSRYNYVLDVTSSASDWYFENHYGNNGLEATSQFNEQVIGDAALGAKTLGTVPVLGFVAKDSSSCSYRSTVFPQQYAFDPYDSSCGDGMYPDGVAGCTSSSGCNIPDPAGEAALTSTAVGPTWAGSWVRYLVQTFGTAANGGVYSYDLDNEPAWWDAVHRDVHPAASTYDEVTNNGIATAQAIKTADPTANVNGPVVDYWWNYFYSKKDIESGWGSGINCYQPWSNPVDREAHGGVPFIEYYLQQFASASTTYGARLLDYLDLHTYFAATYNGSGVGLTTAGDTGEQQARLNSTRVFWDPTYTDPNYPQPNYLTDSNYTTNCNSIPLQAPQLIPMAQAWVAKDYPGTKIAFTEFNWGGQENVNGAVAQADILGIFGSYGLDMATLWGPPDPSTQVPGLMAYEIYRNYDGSNSMFGDMALVSSSANQGTLSVYGALRTSDNAVTVVVINKTYGDLTATLSLANLTPNGTTAQDFLYSNANLNAILAQPAVTIAPPATGSSTSTLSTTFPAQSITLLVVPKK